MDSDDQLFDKIIEFKMIAKQFSKESAKAAAKQKTLMGKIKTSIEKNNTEQAKSYAQEALRCKADAQRYKTLSSKVDTIHSKLQQAYKTKQLTQNMSNLVAKMTGVTGMSDLTKMVETMDNFEKIFDNLDVSDKMMNDVFDNVNSGTVNEGEVNDLIDQLQQHDQLRVGDEMVNASSKNPVIKEKNKEQQQQQQIANGFFP